VGGGAGATLAAAIGVALMAITFDTLKFVETLERANLTREQASAIAVAVRDSHDAADVTTKGDLRNEIAFVRKDIEALENRLVIKLSAVMAALIGLAAAIGKFW